MAASTTTAPAPEQILDDLAGWEESLRIERYWGERSLFYNPGRRAPLGIIWASIKDHDGENDRSANLDRAGVFRFAFQMPADAYEEHFGIRPVRPAKGGVVELPGYDPTRLDLLMPHPVYAWMRWVQILAPSAESFEAIRPHLDQSLDVVRAKWRRRPAG